MDKTPGSMVLKGRSLERKDLFEFPLALGVDIVPAVLEVVT